MRNSTVELSTPGEKYIDKRREMRKEQESKTEEGREAGDASGTE